MKMQKTFSDHSARQILDAIRTKNGAFWSRERERRPLALFHRAARRVPAYKDFLRKHKINPEKIKTFKDFELVPPVDKKNYLRQYPLEKLCWDGTLKKPLVWTATSGSTGEPFYFPRSEALHEESSIPYELFFRQNAERNAGPTLVIVGFGMGLWIGGLIAYESFHITSERNHFPISIITPGINKLEIFKALKLLAPRFAQIILIGYAPFVKDILDEAGDAGVDLKKLNIRIITAAEAYTEKFRDYLAAKAHIRNPYLGIMNIYGSADIGTMAWETPASILIRRLALKNKKLFGEIFTPIEKTPTVAQYNPFFITFESMRGDILLTGDNALPLVRYAIGDHGGTFSFQEAARKCSAHGVVVAREAKLAGIKNHLYELPFVYVYERSDFSTKLYGAIMYPEHIREGIQHPSLDERITGKFTMHTRFNRIHNQFLEVHIELKPNTKPSRGLTKAIEGIVTDSLLERNAEYRNNYQSIPRKVRPRITLWPYEHPLHFARGIKQKWVKK